MPSLAPGFSVVLMTREAPAILRRFVDHYRALGAVRILVFYDGVPETAVPHLGPDVSLKVCDAAFWARHGPRPELVEQRQSVVYTLAKAGCRTEWLLVVDTDEFLFGNLDIASFLGALPRAVEGVRVHTAEAVFGPEDDVARPFGSTWFRRPISGRHWMLAQHVYDRRVRPAMTQGLLGHAAGKHFLRTDARDVVVQIHDSKRGGKDVSTPLADLLPAGRHMWLGHFDAISLPDWRSKWRRRTQGRAVFHDVTRPVRNRQMEEFRQADATGDAATEALFRRLYCLTPLQLMALRTTGAVFFADVFGTAAQARRRQPSFSEQWLERATQTGSDLGDGGGDRPPPRVPGRAA